VTIFLFIVELLKQHSVQESILFAGIWAVVSTTLFIGLRMYQAHKGVECALCHDIPNSVDESADNEM